jgi:hypothetical protein
MNQITLILVACVAIAPYAASQSKNDSTQVASMNYELYSWQGSNGSWNFRVMVSPSGVNVSAEGVFDKKFVVKGVSQLKQKISGLPEGATIFWPDRISLSTGEKARESAKLSYPPAEIIKDIRRYAEAHKIKVEVPSGQQKQH